mgnify:CR=1 FL=1
MKVQIWTWINFSWTNLLDLNMKTLHTKFEAILIAGFKKEDFLKKYVKVQKMVQKMVQKVRIRTRTNFSWTNLIDLVLRKLHTKFEANLIAGFREDFWMKYVKVQKMVQKVRIRTWINFSWTNLVELVIRKLHTKFEINLTVRFAEDLWRNCWRRTTDDGRTTDGCRRTPHHSNSSSAYRPES